MNKQQILDLRKDKKLHKVVENRLIEILKKVSADQYTLKEGIGTTSGRTDTTTFTGNGKVIHVEFIASKNMVATDINNLHQSSADRVIVVLMDEKYDPSVAKEYYSMNAKNLFTRIWLSDLLEPKKSNYIVGKLEIIIELLEREIIQLEPIVQKEFQYFTNKFQPNLDTALTIHLGIFPVISIDILNSVSDERTLFKKFDSFGVSTALDTFTWNGVNLDHNFSHDGKYFNIKMFGADFLFTQMSLGANGTIIFSTVNNKGDKDSRNLSTSNVQSIINKVLNFSINLYKKENFDGLVGIKMLIKGIKGTSWNRNKRIEFEQDIMSKRFYEDLIETGVMKYAIKGNSISNIEKDLYSKIITKLHRNTNRKYKS